MNRLKYPECANCSSRISRNYTNKIATSKSTQLKTYSSQLNSERDDENKLPVKDILWYIYKLNYFEEMANELNPRHLPKDDIVLCDNCSTVLTDLYVAYNRLNELRDRGSFLMAKIKNLDNVVHHLELAQARDNPKTSDRIQLTEEDPLSLTEDENTAESQHVEMDNNDNFNNDEFNAPPAAADDFNFEDDDNESSEEEGEIHAEITGKCPVCQLSFPDVMKAYEHLTTDHFTLYTRNCPICNHQFPCETTYSLLHIQQHLNILHYKPYVCTQCPNRYLTMDELKDHVKLRHDPSMDKPPSARPTDCAYCPKKFALYSSYQRHHRKNHPTEIMQQKERRSRN